MVGMFVELLKSLLFFVLDLLKYVAMLAVPLALIFFVIYEFFMLYYYYKRGMRLKKKDTSTAYKKKSVLRRLFIDAPKQIALDRYRKDPDFFQPQGLIIFTGIQGSGKTVALIEQTMRYQKEYSRCRVIGNLAYKYQDDELRDWTQLIDYKNEKLGVVVQMDETQNWFSSKQSKNFPPEMLSVVTQNRKNRRVILGTAQQFYLLAKDIRTQCTEIRECRTFLSCITVVHRIRPLFNAEGDIEEKKHLGWYFFVHDDELREAYDTYHVIESLRKSDFQERQKDSVIKIEHLIQKEK